MKIGLTGKRHVGKSTAANVLEEHGFIKAHAFDGGKAATYAYFIHLGMTDEMAWESVYGRLRDIPNEYLPNRSTPRYFMEKFGKWMGVELGCEWTLGAELDRIEREYPSAPIVVESVVYEAALFRERGGIIIRVTRPDHEGVAGMETDAAQSSIMADMEIINDGSLEELAAKVLKAVGDLCELPGIRN